MTKKILCTLGPSSLNQKVIARLEDLNVSLFRINLSHTTLEDLPKVIEAIQSFSKKTPICLDSEGAQVRTGIMKDGDIQLEANSFTVIKREPILGTKENISLNYGYVIDYLENGDFINIDFNSVFAQVVAKDDDGVLLRVLNGGKVGSNKAITIQKIIPMPALTPKDIEAIKIGKQYGIKNFALSFANRAEDVQQMRELTGPDAQIISKIECLNGLNNIEGIAEHSDALLVDRGDLSRELPLERIPALQKFITKSGKKFGCEIFVATNLLETMITTPIPTRAEVNDIYNTLRDGVDGLVLAAETAIGKYPTEAVSMIVKMIHEFEKVNVRKRTFYTMETASLLVEPHGGKLVKRVFTPEEKESLPKYPELAVSEKVLMDCEQIAQGTYSPLEGFMNKKDLHSVLENYTLKNGAVWTLPILLQVTKEEASAFSKSGKIVLTNGKGHKHSLLEINDIFSEDLPVIAEKWFGTTSREHPGVENLLNGGKYFIGGKVTLINKMPSPYSHFELTPEQSRYVFKSKGWGKIVGFHTRNIAHQAHEFIQKKALTDSFADGLFISPVLGPKKKGDFEADPILKSYMILIESNSFPKEKVILGGFATYSRYSGPREAVFTALCRKNMGCSHFIIGRDHTGVGNFYDRDANVNLFEKLGDIGIEPLFFNEVGFNKETSAYEESDGTQIFEHISGTAVRESLKNGEHLPAWFIRDEIQEMVKEALDQGEKVFY